MKNKNKQHGVALLTALLVVAIATVIAVAMSHDQQLTLRRTTNLLHNDQAYLYAIGAEAWAKEILLRDDNNIDHTQELWATQLPPTPVPGGVLQGQLQELNDRFNVNNLVSDDDEVNALAYKRLQRLLTYLRLPIQLVDELVDWQDRNHDIYLPNGAEDDVYLLHKPAYRPANQILRSPSELRLLHSMTSEHYATLLPYVSTLPRDSALNINTAPLAVLVSLAEGMDENALQTLIQDREAEPFTDLTTFMQHPSLAGIQVSDVGLDVKSQYFLFSADAEIERGRVQLNSVLQRDNKHVQVLLRSRGKW